MTVATVRAVLAAAGSVTALVPAARIEALSAVQIDIYAADYTNALTIATAVRAALEADASRMTLQSQIERNEPETDPELFQISQTWNVFS
jgi:hypothetical protein